MDYETQIKMLRDNLQQVFQEDQADLERRLAEDIRRGNTGGQQYYARLLEELRSIGTP